MLEWTINTFVSISRASHLLRAKARIRIEFHNRASLFFFFVLNRASAKWIVVVGCIVMVVSRKEFDPLKKDLQSSLSEQPYHYHFLRTGDDETFLL
jgi:hypothetical protein